MIQKYSQSENEEAKVISKMSEYNSSEDKEKSQDKSKDKSKDNNTVHERDEFQSQTNFLYKKHDENDLLEQMKENINTDQTIQNSDDINDSDISSFKLKLDRIITNSYFKFIFDFLSFFFAITICAIYIIFTYFPFANQTWFNIFNYLIATFYNFQFILELYLAQHRCAYLLELQTWIHLFTSIFPYFSTVKIDVIKQFVEGSRVFHIFRVTEFIQKYLKINENDVVKHVVNMVLEFVTIILVACLVFRIVEIDTINNYLINPDNREYSLVGITSFHDFLYYTVVTIATVGYGELYPLSEQGRIVIICLIFLAAYMIPKETGQLLTLLENTSIYSREIYKSNQEIPHLVICGHVSVDAMISFCDELFHMDHGQTEKNVIIIDPAMPSQEMRLFLHAGKYEVNLRYLQGDPMLEKDLDRTDIIKAKATVILTNKYSDKPHSTDHKNILLALGIKKYFLKKRIYDSTLFIQLIKPENKIHYLSGLESLSINNKISSDRMIILEEIKMNLLSKSCLIPGIIPLIANLVRSSGSEEETEYSWLNEYLEGSGQEIYRAKLNETFKNKTFSQISKLIYRNFDGIAFALEIEIQGKTLIILNPGGFFIEKFLEQRNDVKFYLYVICSDKDVADRISNADAEEVDNNNNNDSEENNLGNDDEIITDNKNKKKNLTKFQEYMNLGLADIIQLDENSLYNADVKDEEDDYFFIANKMGIPPDVKKDSIRNSTIYRDHIVVCGTHPSLYYYLLPLRAKYFGKENLKYVVILTQDMPKDLWDSIARFEKIILINGSPLCIEDLYRANIEYASKAVILENENIKNCSFSDKMIDSERVFIYRAIKKCNPNIQIMTELVFESNIEYMLPQDELSRMDVEEISYETMSVFSSGEVYISSIIDSLIAQAYYNKHIVTIIHQLLAGGKNNMNSTLKHICDNIGLKTSNFWQMEIPEKFINKTFGELYDEFCDNNLIALGLYRLPGARDNNTAYVYTKPNIDTRITHRDRVFVLSVDSINNVFNEDNNIQEEKKGDDVNFLNNNNDDSDRKVINENGGRGNFTPFAYVQDVVTQIEKEVDNLGNMLESTKNTIHESVASGIKQEIISLLH